MKAATRCVGIALQEFALLAGLESPFRSREPGT
jgi:hypothetical protein